MVVLVGLVRKPDEFREGIDPGPFQGFPGGLMCRQLLDRWALLLDARVAEHTLAIGG